jgi:hypothetical protein
MRASKFEMQLDPHEFADLESVRVSVTEQHPDGTCTIRYYDLAAGIPELVEAAFGTPEMRELNALDLGELIRQAHASARESRAQEVE